MYMIALCMHPLTLTHTCHLCSQSLTYTEQGHNDRWRTSLDCVAQTALSEAILWSTTATCRL